MSSEGPHSQSQAGSTVMVRFSLRPMGNIVTVCGLRLQLSMLSSAVKLTGFPKKLFHYNFIMYRIDIYINIEIESPSHRVGH